MDNMFESIIGIVQMKCGHYIHNKCLTEYLNTSYKCPTCLKSIIETDEINKFIDDEVMATPMPDEYKDIDLEILCNDCLKKSNVKFHIVGLKCQHCFGYNTKKI